MSTVELANGDKIYLRSFNSNQIGEFFSFVKDNGLLENNCGRVHATGGGAFKYEDMF
jgi:pantothenate kinase